MIIEHLAQLERELKKDLENAKERVTRANTEVNAWDRYAQEKVRELLDLQEIIRNAQKPREYTP